MNQCYSSRGDWEALVAACKHGKVADIDAVDFATNMPTLPPIGQITRDMLNIWARCKKQPSGGLFRFKEGFGFYVSENRSEPFLSRVCSADRSTQYAVLRDLAERDQLGGKEVFERIGELAAIAAVDMPNIGRMAMPAPGKQMYLSMCQFMIRLGDAAKEAQDGRLYGMLNS